MGIDSTAEDYDLSLHTLSLEREYDQTVSTAAQLLDQEARRVHRVDQLLQQFENENLQQQLDQARQEIGRVRSAELEILGRLNQVALERDRIQQTVYVLGHEKENLARELESMSDTSVEVKTLMMEKMRLAKELAGVQTEVQRLQSVESSSQTLLAEKQALSRQLSSLEVELENERRAHERTRSARGGSEQQQQQQQQQLQQQLQKQQQQQQAATAKWNAEKAALEDKIETLTKKLFATKDQLRKAQINNSNSSSSIQQQQPLQAGTSIVPVKWSREQSSTDRYAAAARINPELTIATPGAVRAKNAEREKRAAAVAALPGEKSAFSITPFLNRTTGAPSAEADSNENHADNANNDSDQESSSLEDSIIREPDVPAPTTAAAAAAQRSRQLSLGLGKARPEKTTAATTTTTATAGNSRRPRQASRRLDPIDDDDDDDIFGAGNVSMLAKPQVRKRKLGGQQKKLIIDEEDDDMDFDFRKAGTARGRGFGGVPAFSPLKRDRR